MSHCNTKKEALKLLRIQGATLNPDTFDEQVSESKMRRSSCPHMEVTIKAKPSSNQNRASYIRKISEMESTPEYSSASDDEDSLFDDTEDPKHQKKDVRDVADGIELMLHQLQSQAKQLEQKRYQLFATGSTASTPHDIVQLTRHKSKRSNNQSAAPMNWWDQPFKDYLKASSRPIVRETGIDQFASEYMLTMLRDQEQKVLRQRMIVEEQRTRPPLDNWYEMKGQKFNKELRRFKRQKK